MYSPGHEKRTEHISMYPRSPHSGFSFADRSRMAGPLDLTDREQQWSLDMFERMESTSEYRSYVGVRDDQPH